MHTLSVPEVIELPRLAPNEEDAVAFADMVLTALLRRDSGVLSAQCSDVDAKVSWFIAPSDDRERSSEVVAISPSLGSFRSLLARFGHHYMDDQLYSGYALRFLTQRSEVHRCHIYMSNNSQSGFWIKVYAARITEPSGPANGSQPFRSERNPTSSAAGSRR